jgi:hypothetical protein
MTVGKVLVQQPTTFYWRVSLEKQVEERLLKSRKAPADKAKGVNKAQTLNFGFIVLQ